MSRNRRSRARRKVRKVKEALNAGLNPVKNRNTVVIAMISRSQKAGSHGDARKKASREACRGRVRW